MSFSAVAENAYMVTATPKGFPRLYDHRHRWAFIGTVGFACVMVLAAQVFHIEHAAPSLPATTVDLIELPALTAIQPARTEPPAPRPPLVRHETPPPSLVQVAKQALQETAQTIAVAPPKQDVAPMAPQQPVEPPPAPVPRADIKTAATPPVAPQSNARAEGVYQAAARAGIERHKRYPDEALQMNMTGVVTLTYSISREGRLIRVDVEKSSGYALLDRAALDAVRRTRFESMPEDAWMGLKEQTFRTRIEFSIH
jgi:TonB family protein